MQNFLKKLGVGIFLLLTLTACVTAGASRLKVLPEAPKMGFLFQTCIQHGISYPCLDQKNAVEFVEYIRDVEVYIKMVEGLRD